MGALAQSQLLLTKPMPAPTLIIEGPYRGWNRWHASNEGRFTDHLGEIYYRDGAYPDGSGVVCAMETARHHSNGLGFLHGGLLMAFVDVALFTVIRHQLSREKGAVTLQASTDFIGAGTVGKPLEGRGHVVKESGKLIWVAGTLTQDDGAHLVAQWHGILRKIIRKP